MVTLLMLGTVFSITMVSLSETPLALPSSGVTVQVTVSPPAKPLNNTGSVEESTPFIVQLMIDWSISESASLKPDHAQVSVSVALAGLGLMETPAILGTLLEMVTVFDVTATPSSVPSFGVTLQETLSFLSKSAPVRVSEVAAIGALLTLHA
jgi:hypothetical protein